MIKIATAVTTDTLREDLGLLIRAGHPVTAALTRFIAKSNALVEEYAPTADQTTKDLVINDLCANMVQNWFVNNDEKRKGPRRYFPTTLTLAMQNTLDEDFVGSGDPKDDAKL